MTESRKLAKCGWLVGKIGKSMRKFFSGHFGHSPGGSGDSPDRQHI